MDAKYVLKGTVAGGLVAALAVSVWGEESQPHAEYQGVTPSTNVGFSLSGGAVSNVSSTATMVLYSPAALSLESLIPRDHLIIQVASLIPPSGDASPEAFTSGTQRTGMDPFFQRRPNAIRAESDSPRIPPRRNFHSRRTDVRGKKE